MFKFYFFQNTYDSIVVNIINAIIFGIGVFSWGYVILKKVNLRWNKVLIVLTLMLMPLGLNCFYVLLEGKMYHMLYFPYQLFYLICFYPIMRTAVDGNNIKLGRFLSIFLVAILSFIIIRFSNDLFYYQKNVGDSSKIAIGNIIYEIERCEGFNKDDNYIIIEGDIHTALQAKYKYSEVYGNVAGVSNLGTTFTYNQTMIWYLKEAIGKDYMFEESPEIRDKIIRSKEAVNMPCYPYVGYARMIDGYLLLKFTDELNQ